MSHETNDGDRDTNQALQILSLTHHGKGLVVNQGRVDQITSRIRDANVSRLSIVSVAGSFRTGKSFMLDLMVMFLDAHEGRELTNNTEWASHKCVTNQAFSWKPGVKRHTLGIWMYNKVFVRIIGGVRVGIILMDTQGLWDGESDHSLVTSIFGLSAVISSVQIYNLMRTVELDKLDQIKWFSGFGASALSIRLDGKPTRKTKSIGAQFQSLHIMVRDWVGFVDDCDRDQCRRDSIGFLRAQRCQEEFGKFMGHIDKMYTSVEAVLLPPPGEKCCFSKSFDGDLGSVEQGFLINISSYFHHIFESPVIKQFNGAPLTANGFRELIQEFASIFQSEEMPTTLSFAEAMESTLSMCARETALGAYTKLMDDWVQSVNASGFMAIKEGCTFENSHDKSRNKAMSVFSKLAVYGEETTIEAERVKLHQLINIAREHANLKHMEMHRHVFTVAAPYICIAFIAFLLDKSTDFVCDWWLDVCQDVSMVLFYGYAYGACVFCVWVALVTYRRGSLDTMQAIVTLGEDISRVLALWKDRIVQQYKHHATLHGKTKLS